jgi:hypothetical protein
MHALNTKAYLARSVIIFIALAAGLFVVKIPYPILIRRCRLVTFVVLKIDAIPRAG